MELERLQVVIEASLGDFKKKMTAVKQIVNSATGQVKAETDKIKYSMDNMPGNVKTASMDKLREKIKSVNSDLAAMYARMDEIKASKYAELSEMPFTSEPQLDTAVENVLNKDKAYQKLGDSIRKAEQELERYKVTLAETNALQDNNSNKSNKLADVFNRVKSTLSKAKGQTSSFSKNLKGLNLASIPLSKSILKLSTMFKLMALRMVMRAAINAIKKGFVDLAKYSSTFNGTMSQISSVLLQARNSLATAFAPALQALMPIITGVTNAFINAFNTIGMFTARLFGNAVIFTKAKQVTTDYAKSLGGTEKAAKKAGKTLASFDEINVLTQDEDTGVPDASQMFQEVTIPDESISAIDKFKNKINELIEPLRNISFNNLTSAFDRLKEAILPFTNTIFEVLEWAHLNVFIPLANWTVSNILPTFLNALSGALGIISSVIEALKPAAVWLWDNFLQPLAAWTGGIIVRVLGWIDEKLNTIGKWMRDNKSVVEDITLIIGSFAVAWIIVTTAIKAWNTAVLIWNSIGMIASAVTGAFGTAVAFLTSPIGLVIIAIGAIIATIILLIKYWNQVSEVAVATWENIKGIWSVVATWFKENVTDPIRKFFIDCWEGILKWWDEKMSPWFTKEKWMGIMKGVRDGIVESFKNAINAAISLFNNFISWLNEKMRFSWDGLTIAGKQIIPPGSVQLFTIPNIPRLASGAVIPPNNEFLAVLGDQKSGTNIEAPEGLIRQIVREELSGLNVGGQKITINFAGNMSQLIRVLKPYIDDENSRVGNKLVIGGTS